MGHAIGVASRDHTDSLHDARAAQLFGHHLLVPHLRLLDRVGLDAPHEVGLGRLDDGEELRELLLELGHDALELGTLLAVEHELGLVGGLGEELAHSRLVGAAGAEPGRIGVSSRKNKAVGHGTSLKSDDRRERQGMRAARHESGKI